MHTHGGRAGNDGLPRQMDRYSAKTTYAYSYRSISYTRIVALAITRAAVAQMPLVAGWWRLVACYRAETWTTRTLNVAVGAHSDSEVYC